MAVVLTSPKCTRVEPR